MIVNYGSDVGWIYINLCICVYIDRFHWNQDKYTYKSKNSIPNPKYNKKSQNKNVPSKKIKLTPKKPTGYQTNTSPAHKDLSKVNRILENAKKY